MFPNLPGVPALSRKNVLAAVVTVAAPLINNLLDLLKPVWGIYDATGLTVVIKPDSFLSVEYRNEMQVSNYPIEHGAFSSYNKVRTPNIVELKITKGSALTAVGTSSHVSDRDSFLKKLDQLTASLDLYTIKTPEAEYINMNLEQYDYRREVKNGAGIIIASLRFVEIIEASVLLGSSTPQNPSAQAPIDNGMCQLNSPYTGVPYTFH
jgi:hypothetical protein